MKHLLVGACALLACNVLLASDWVLLAKSKSSTWEARAGTFKRDADGHIFVAQGRRHVSETDRISFERWYVTRSDCQAGYGRLFTTTLDGEPKGHGVEFALKGGTVASGIADVLCELGLQSD